MLQEWDKGQFQDLSAQKAAVLLVQIVINFVITRVIIEVASVDMRGVVVVGYLIKEHNFKIMGIYGVKS